MNARAGVGVYAGAYAEAGTGLGKSEPPCGMYRGAGAGASACTEACTGPMMYSMEAPGVSSSCWRAGSRCARNTSAKFFTFTLLLLAYRVITSSTSAVTMPAVSLSF